MTSVLTTGREPSALRERDPWDEDELGEDDSWGPSWSKAYVGGIKVRQYVASSAAACIEPFPGHQPRLRG